MTDYKLTRYEKETIILFNEADKEAIVETYRKPLIRCLFNHAEKYPELFHLEEDIGDGGYKFIVPKKYVTVRSPRKMSDEQKQKNADRLKALHSKTE